MSLEIIPESQMSLKLNRIKLFFLNQDEKTEGVVKTQISPITENSEPDRQCKHFDQTGGGIKIFGIKIF